MTNDKFKMPEGAFSAAREQAKKGDPAPVQTESIKTERAGIEASGRVEVAKLAVAQEAIKSVTAFLDVVKSSNQVKTTVAEWQGRITQAEISVKKAKVELDKEIEKNSVRKEELDQSRESLKRLLEAFDFVMEGLKSGEAGLSDKENRQLLLELSGYLVQMKK